MVTWIKDFSNEYEKSTGRYPGKFNVGLWVKACSQTCRQSSTLRPAGGNPAQATVHHSPPTTHCGSRAGRLRLEHFLLDGGKFTIPSHYEPWTVLNIRHDSYYSFWQYDDTGVNPGDADEWNGTAASLTTYVLSVCIEILKLIADDDLTRSDSRRAEEAGVEVRYYGCVYGCCMESSRL